MTVFTHNCKQPLKSLTFSSSPYMLSICVMLFLCNKHDDDDDGICGRRNKLEQAWFTDNLYYGK